MVYSAPCGKSSLEKQKPWRVVAARAIKNLMTMRPGHEPRARLNSGYISLFKVLGKTFGMPKLTVYFHDVPECQLDFFDVFVAKSTTHYSSPPSLEFNGLPQIFGAGYITIHMRLSREKCGPAQVPVSGVATARPVYPSSMRIERGS